MDEGLDGITCYQFLKLKIVDCMHVRVRVPDPLQMNLQTVVRAMRVQGIEPESSGRAASAVLTADPSSLAQCHYFKCHLEITQTKEDLSNLS